MFAAHWSSHEGLTSPHSHPSSIRDPTRPRSVTMASYLWTLRQWCRMGWWPSSRRTRTCRSPSTHARASTRACACVSMGIFCMGIFCMGAFCWVSPCSSSYLQEIVREWDEMGVLKQVRGWIQSISPIFHPAHAASTSHAAPEAPLCTTPPLLLHTKSDRIPPHPAQYHSCPTSAPRSQARVYRDDRRVGNHACSREL